MTAHGFRPLPLMVSSALGSWATGTVESYTTDMMTDVRKLRQRGDVTAAEGDSVDGTAYSSSGPSTAWVAAVTLLRLSL